MWYNIIKFLNIELGWKNQQLKKKKKGEKKIKRGVRMVWTDDAGDHQPDEITTKKETAKTKWASRSQS